MFQRKSTVMTSVFGSHPCESCGRELPWKLSRKTCSNCQLTYCNQCVVSNYDSFLCHKCKVFTSDLIHRSQLEEMSPTDLRFYFMHNRIVLPSSDDVSSLIEGILVNQAQVLSQRALEAQRMLRDPALLGTFNFMSHEHTSNSSPNLASSASTPLPSTQPLASSLETSFIKRKDFVPGSVTNVSDLQCEEEIDLLPVKILKIILQRNCIDYRGCVEKEELKERVQRLWKARTKQKLQEDKIAGDLDAENEFLCKICMDEPVDCVLLDCGHMLTCVKCGRQLNECPVCRQYIIKVVHAFKV